MRFWLNAHLGLAVSRQRTKVALELLGIETLLAVPGQNRLQGRIAPFECLSVADFDSCRVAELSALPSGGVSPRLRQLDLTLGDLVEIAGRRYEVVPDRMGGVTLEPPIRLMAELEKRWGTRPVSAEEFERVAGDLPTDDER